MQMALSEIQLIPAQIDGLSHPQTMAGHKQDQRAIALPITALSGPPSSVGLAEPR